MGQPALQLILKNLTVTEEEPDNTLHAYFQPPESQKLAYPCIRYELDTGRTHFADNLPYRHTQRYTLTIMDYDVDKALEIYNLVAALPMCTHLRSYAAESLNHSVFTIYF